MTDMKALITCLMCLIIIVIACFIGVTNPRAANKALDALGMTNIKMTGYNFFACGENDWYRTGFKATNAQGKAVSGTVCSGLFFKNSTVRFD